MSDCPHYTDGRHRGMLNDPTPTCVCGKKIPVSLFDLVEAPARGRDPYPSHQAAARNRRKAGTQAARILTAIVDAGALGASTREIQRALFNPAEPAWNKVPTRCLSLERKGLVRRTGETRPEDGQRFLVYEATAAGHDHQENR